MAIRVTSTGQTTFVKKVVIGTPVRSVTGSGANFTSLSDVTITSASNKQIITFDSASQKFINTDSATLANLTVSGDILPAADSSSSLGSATKKFKNLFLSGDTITLGTLRLKDSGGGLGVVDSVGTSKPLSLEGSKDTIRSFFSGGGDLTYNSSTGQFSIDVETVYTKTNFDSDLGAALDGGTGITYDSSSDTISITNTGVTAATYGSASQVPQIAVNAQGQITSASNVSIAGVTGVTYDSSNGALTVSTSAGSSFTDSINLNPFSTTNLSEGTNLYFTNARADARVNLQTGANLDLSNKSTTDLSEGNNLYYTTARADSAFDDRFDSSFDERLATKSTTNLSEGSNLYFTTGRADARVNLQTGANLDLSSKSTSDLSEGTNLYFTTARADSDAKNAISSGTGISYNSNTGEITTNDGQIVHDNLSGFVANEHIDHSGVSIVAGKGLSGGGTIASSRTIDIDSANVRGMFSGSNGISYTSGTGDIRAPQPLDSAANPTFNQLRGPAEFIIDPAAIGDATGTVKIMGNLQVQGTQTTINSSTIVLKDKNIVIADSAADSSALNGAGLTWGDSAIANNPTFNYNHAEARFDANRSISASTFVGNLAGNASGSAATVTNAAQTNITSLGTLTGLTSTGDVTVDSAGGFLFDVSDKALEFGDNYKATFGAGSDLQIFHDGSNSRIYGTTGDTLIGQNTFGAVKLTSNNDAENMLVATVNGAVELYYNNSKKFETTNAGATVSGTLAATLSTATQGNITSLGTLTGLTSTGDVAVDSAGGFLFDVSDKALEFGDNYKATFGDGGDLDIYHDGSNSYVQDDGTGELRILSSFARIRHPSGTTSATFYPTNSVDLYYNTTKRFETTDSGAKVTGQIVADSATMTLATITGLGVGSTSEALNPVSGQLAVGGARLRDWSDASTDIDALIGGSTFGNIIEGRLNAHLVLGIRNNDTNDGVTIISSDSSYGTNSLYTNHVVSFKADGDIEIDSAGAIMYDKSDKALEFGDNYKASFGAGGDFQIFHNGTHSYIQDAGTGDLVILTNQIAIRNAAQNADIIRGIQGGAVTLSHNGSAKLATASGGVSITGTATATTFSGSGASLTNLPAGQLTGTIDSARLPTGTFGGGGGGGGGLDSAAVLTVAGTGIFNTTGEAGTAATAGTATNVTVSANNSTNETVYPTFVDGATGTQGLETDTGLTYNPSTGRLTAVSFFAPTFEHNGGTVTVDASEGKVVLTHQGSTKLETASGGIDVNGSVIVGTGDTFTLDGSETTTSSTSQTALVTVAKATYGAAKFLVTAVSSSERHITEIYATHDGTTGVATEYGTVTTNGILATYDVDINSSNFRLLATPASSTSTTFKVVQTLIEA